MMLGPYLALGQNELQARFGHRASKDLQDAITALRAGIDTFRASSNAASNRLIWLTRVLVVETILLLVVTIALFWKG